MNFNFSPSSNATSPFNLTEDLSDGATRDFVEQHLGLRHRSIGESVVLTVVYVLIFMTGIVGNLCTGLIVISKSYMRTSTNFYLCSLAISDLLTLLLGLPPEVYTIWEAYPWVFGQPYCLFKTFLTEMTSSASILTITAFTVERYLAICYPLLAQTLSSLSRALKIICCLWIAACITALPYPLFTRTYFYLRDPDTGLAIEDSLICNIPARWMDSMRVVFQLSTFLLFILPITIISALYVMIGITIRRSATTSTNQHSDISPKHSQPRKAVLKMLVAVVVAFFICWAPFHVQRLTTIYTSDRKMSDQLMEVQSALFYISGVLYFVSCTVNPILYNLMSRRYRQAFKETLCRCRMQPAVSKKRLPTLLARGEHRSGLSTSRRWLQSTANKESTNRLPSLKEHSAANRMPSLIEYSISAANRNGSLMEYNGSPTNRNASLLEYSMSTANRNGSLLEYNGSTANRNPSFKVSYHYSLPLRQHSEEIDDVADINILTTPMTSPAEESPTTESWRTMY